MYLYGKGQRGYLKIITWHFGKVRSNEKSILQRKKSPSAIPAKKPRDPDASKICPWTPFIARDSLCLRTSPQQLPSNSTTSSNPTCHHCNGLHPTDNTAAYLAAGDWMFGPKSFEGARRAAPPSREVLEVPSLRNRMFKSSISLRTGVPARTPPPKRRSKQPR